MSCFRTQRTWELVHFSQLLSLTERKSVKINIFIYVNPFIGWLISISLPMKTSESSEIIYLQASVHFWFFEKPPTFQFLECKHFSFFLGSQFPFTRPVKAFFRGLSPPNNAFCLWRRQSNHKGVLKYVYSDLLALFSGDIVARVFGNLLTTDFLN